MNDLKTPVIILIVLIALGGAYFYLTTPEFSGAPGEMAEPPPRQEIARTQTSPRLRRAEQQDRGEPGDQASAVSEEKALSYPKVASTPQQPEPQTSIDVDPSLVDVEAALKPRILGNPDAPIKISEHSSLTCSHCGSFHQNAFKNLKAEYIDTGRAYLVFTDFPLNAPALHGSMIARCLDEDRYFDFIQMLFEKQDQWAYERNYMDFLRKAAAEYGMSTGAFDACLNDDQIQTGLLETAEAVQKQWDISSTPSFVINNQTVISGALPYEEFKTRLEDAVSPSAGEDEAAE